MFASSSSSYLYLTFILFSQPPCLLSAEILPGKIYLQLSNSSSWLLSPAGLASLGISAAPLKTHGILIIRDFCRSQRN